jgi:hypothetical protein
MKRYTLTPYAGNKAKYPVIEGKYNSIIDFFGGSLGGTLKTAIDNPNCIYLVAEASNTQRALIEGLKYSKSFYKTVLLTCKALIEEFHDHQNYSVASKWFTSQYDSFNTQVIRAALSVMRRFFFSAILRTTPGSGNINVSISPRKILGDKRWKEIAEIIRPGLDYNSLTNAEVKQFNAELGQYVFTHGQLRDEMIKSVNSWYASLEPILDEWFSVERHIEVYSTYEVLLNDNYCKGKTLLYIDAPYYNPHKGVFIDESGKKRIHKQTPSYEHHKPDSLETWDMFLNPLYMGLNTKADMVLCNYSSSDFEDSLYAMSEYYDLETVVENKSCLCTGKRSKYTVLPQGKETVIFAKPKVLVQSKIA